MAKKPSENKLLPPEGTKCDSGTLSLRSATVFGFRGNTIIRAGETLTIEELGRRTAEALTKGKIGRMIKIVPDSENEEDD